MRLCCSLKQIAALRLPSWSDIDPESETELVYVSCVSISRYVFMHAAFSLCFCFTQLFIFCTNDLTKTISCPSKPWGAPTVSDLTLPTQKMNGTCTSGTRGAQNHSSDFTTPIRKTTDACQSEQRTTPDSKKNWDAVLNINKNTIQSFANKLLLP